MKDMFSVSSLKIHLAGPSIILPLCDIINTSINHGTFPATWIYSKVVGCITLDFRKAFDVLCHEILNKKLALYGCDHLTLSWFSSYYLSDRSQQGSFNFELIL